MADVTDSAYLLQQSALAGARRRSSSFAGYVPAVREEAPLSFLQPQQNGCSEQWATTKTAVDSTAMQFPNESTRRFGPQETSANVWSDTDSDFEEGGHWQGASAQPDHLNCVCGGESKFPGLKLTSPPKFVVAEVGHAAIKTSTERGSGCINGESENGEWFEEATLSVQDFPFMAEPQQPEASTPTQMYLDKVPGQEQLGEPSLNVAITTLMLRNLPRTATQAELMAQLDLYGFAGMYDFCHMPRCFQSGENKGFAFVNLTSAAAAAGLVGAWHHQRPFGVAPSQAALNISSAALQGFDANVRKWATSRSRRIRNPDYAPFVRRDRWLHGEAPVTGMKMVPSVLSQSLAQVTTSKSHGGQRQQRQRKQQRVPGRLTPAGERVPGRLTPAGERVPMPSLCNRKR